MSTRVASLGAGILAVALLVSDMTFHGDSFEGVIQMGAGANAMTVHMSAKRTGGCR